MNKINIKHVKKAHQWCVTYWKHETKKDIQCQEWCSTKEEALLFKQKLDGQVTTET